MRSDLPTLLLPFCSLPTYQVVSTLRRELCANLPRPSDDQVVIVMGQTAPLRPRADLSHSVVGCSVLQARGLCQVRDPESLSGRCNNDIKVFATARPDRTWGMSATTKVVASNFALICNDVVGKFLRGHLGVAVTI
jgi:hypothetical protein